MKLRCRVFWVALACERRERERERGLELSADRSLGIRRTSFMMFYLPKELYFIVGRAGK